MSLRNKISALVLSLALAVLAACGGSDNPSNPPIAPPSGAFSNSTLIGTYVFSFSGYDATQFNSSFFTVVGTLTANGSGSFTSGSLDVDDPALGAAFQTAYVFTHLPASQAHFMSRPPMSRAAASTSGMISATSAGSVR